MKTNQRLDKKRMIRYGILGIILIPGYVLLFTFCLGFNYVSVICILCMSYIVRRDRDRSSIRSLEDTGDALLFEYYDCFRIREESISYDDMDVHFDHFNKKMIIISSKKASTYWPKYFQVKRRETDEDWLMSVFDAHGISIPNK